MTTYSPAFLDSLVGDKFSLCFIFPLSPFKKTLIHRKIHIPFNSNSDSLRHTVSQPTSLSFYYSFFSVIQLSPHTLFTLIHISPNSLPFPPIHPFWSFVGWPTLIIIYDYPFASVLATTSVDCLLRSLLGSLWLLLSRG